MPGGTGLEFCAVQIPQSNKTTDKPNGVIFTVPPTVQKDEGLYRGFGDLPNFFWLLKFSQGRKVSFWPQARGQDALVTAGADAAPLSARQIGQ